MPEPLKRTSPAQVRASERLPRDPTEVSLEMDLQWIHWHRTEPSGGLLWTLWRVLCFRAEGATWQLGTRYSAVRNRTLDSMLPHRHMLGYSKISFQLMTKHKPAFPFWFRLHSQRLLVGTRNGNMEAELCALHSNDIKRLLQSNPNWIAQPNSI
jgi:hypothetical protein